MKKAALKRKHKATRPYIVVRALRAMEAEGVNVFSFFMLGADVARIADISRVERDQGDPPEGFQQREIRTHVRGVVDRLNQGSVLFPNAIMLAMSPERVAWVVDGCSLALAESNTPAVPIPVVAFISDDIGAQREQFILVNKAQPLATRLINELLPETRPRNFAA